jgi:hypothetical protein
MPDVRILTRTGNVCRHQEAAANTVAQDLAALLRGAWAPEREKLPREAGAYYRSAIFTDPLANQW